MAMRSPLLNQMKTMAYGSFSNGSLSVVPLFLLMGQFASLGGMSKALFKAAEAFLGHRSGGVGMAAIGACAGFGSICGSSMATAATMGQVALPELKRAGYAGSLASGALAAGGTLGILIPPSIVLVIYAILAEQNIAKMFAAAFVPGILAALGYMAVISISVRVNPKLAGQLDPMPWPERWQALAAVWPVLADLRDRDRRHLYRHLHADRRRCRRRRRHRAAGLATWRARAAPSCARPSRPPPAARRWSS